MSFLNRLISFILPEPILPDYIDEGVLEDCLSAAQGSHPNEFLALLIAEHSSNLEFTEPNTEIEDEYVITSYYVIPGTKSSPTSASFQQINIPVSGKIVGSFHSHPNGATHPSPEDSNMFRKYPVNIIAGHPYSMDSWEVYGPDSNPRSIELTSVEDSELSEHWFENIDEF